MGPEDGIYRDRIREHTAPPVNARIDERTQTNIRGYTSEQATKISQRLLQLDREWDVDRALMMNFAVLGGLTFWLGKRFHRGWHWVFGSQLAFMAWHALVGWCPPVLAFRRLGFRTQKEIGVERRALLDALDHRLR